MKGYLTSYCGLFEPHDGARAIVRRIEIPLIQRDYAQGRQGLEVDEIRKNFLEVLLAAIAGGEPVALDFVYGRVDDGIFKPLDGQQRLTTLFLLHWYLASAAGELVPDAEWTRFSYATRSSARRFCERLCEQPIPPYAGRPSAWVTDQPWYLYVWRDDPTIQAMLVMLDAIHDDVARSYPDLDARAAWRRLSAAESEAVTFYLLPLDDMDSDEELYIKMNSRGKPLTPFENFKARFERDISHSARAGEFSVKIDGQWADLLWPVHGGDFIVDDELMRYFGYVTELCEFRDSSLVQDRRIGPRARAVFGQGNPRSAEHLDLLFGAFDVWKTYGDAEAAFDRTFSTLPPGSDGYSPNKVRIFGATSTNLLRACVRGFRIGLDQNPAFPRPLGLLLYGVVIHRLRGSEDFGRRIRILRNLIAASEDEIRRVAMPALLEDVERVVIDGDLSAVARFNKSQVVDEELKRRFLHQYPAAATALFRLEDHAILRGTLSAFDFDDAVSFSRRAIAFERAFANPSEWEKLTGALLAIGDYQRRPRGWEAWQFGTGSGNNESVWRFLLTGGTREGLSEVRGVLADFLDGLAASSADAGEHMESVMDIWLREREQARVFDWRYYLIKYPSMRSGESGIYYGIDGRMGYMLCMMRKTQRNSLYRDPILLEIFRSAGVAGRAVDPWFTGYETVPRWLKLINSGVGLRCVERGFELLPPEEGKYDAAFAEVCRAHGAEWQVDGPPMLKVAQLGDTDHGTDTVDRVVVGASLLRDLVAAGL